MNTINFFNHLKNTLYITNPAEIIIPLYNAQDCLMNLNSAYAGVQLQGSIGLTPIANPLQVSCEQQKESYPLVSFLPVVSLSDFGNKTFAQTYHCRYAYYAGAMANAITSEEMVIALGKNGFLASFGAAGLLPQRIERAIEKIKSELPEHSFLFNVINSPNEPELEERVVNLYLQHNIHAVEASAYILPSLPLVYYRAVGLQMNQQGIVQINNRIVAKISRKETAKHFMQPAPDELLNKLIEAKEITPQQAELARKVPLADDITVEADSGGHTDNRPLVLALPAILDLRDEVQAKYNYQQPVRVGAAGGIATPQAAYAAFLMGAEYIVTGSINQATPEAGTSDAVKKLLSQAEMTDVTMAPAADMFEMGVKVQVLKRGSMFAMRALKLYELYARYPSVESIPSEEKEKLEKQIFKKSIEEVWKETQLFFNERDKAQIERAKKDEKLKMALIFRWYLGLSSHWAVKGEKGREMDYQIWCGPSMGAFNDWVRGTRLENYQNRNVVEIAKQLLQGVGYLKRLHTLQAAGIEIPLVWRKVKPQ